MFQRYIKVDFILKNGMTLHEKFVIAQKKKFGIRYTTKELYNDAYDQMANMAKCLSTAPSATSNVVCSRYTIRALDISAIKIHGKRKVIRKK